MNRWITLLRGVNVGGKNILPMADLRSALTDAAFNDPRTYIQSGNVSFGSELGEPAKIESRVADVIEARFGFRPQVLVMSADRLHMALANNPFPEAETAPKTLHFFFLSRPAAQADHEAIEAIKAPSERTSLTDQVFYLHAPDGIGRSKLAAKAENLLGVPVTARNLRSVQAIAQMARP